MERRSRNRDIGERQLCIPPKRKRAYFFKGMDGKWNVMVKAPGHSAEKPKAIVFVR